MPYDLFGSGPFLGEVKLALHLGQQKALFKGDMDDFTNKDFQDMEGLLPGSSETIQAICHNMRWYEKSLKARDAKGASRDLKLINKHLDKLGDKEEALWVYLYYCNVPPAILNELQVIRREERPERFRGPTATPGRPAIPSQTGTRTQGMLTPKRSVSPMVPSINKPLSVATPGTIPTTPLRAQSFTPTALPAPPPPPRYTDTPTGGAPQYSTDLQRQIDSYNSKVAEFASKPRPYTDVYSRAPAPTPTAPCPPGQFPAYYPGGPCRQGVATGGLPGLPGLTNGSASVSPGAMTSAGTFTSMGKSYRVANQG